MAKRTGRKFGMKKAWIALNVLQKGINGISEWKDSKINGYVLKKVKHRRMHYDIGKHKIFSKELKAKILKTFINQILVNKGDFKKSAALAMCSINNLALNQGVDSPRTIIIGAVKEVLNNLPKVALISPLVDSGVASVEVVYLVLKRRMTKREAFRHLTKEAAGSINSSAIMLGTLLILRALSYVPTPGCIAILLIAQIAAKKLKNKHTTK